MSTEPPPAANPRLEIQDMATNHPFQFSLLVQSLVILCPRPFPCREIDVTEQKLPEKALSIVQSWVNTGNLQGSTTAEPWNKAAGNLRLPYWDRNAGTPPILSDLLLTVIMPNNGSLQHDNILMAMTDCLPGSA
ncbi:hypothetical protein BDZ94DRAFT_1268846 [Collybia nuda]|uniref:Uncharacterized protein n=1 Tax=Collybia nuda TaxID=64659 RepID=A0A9P5XWV1_9AGAR|nr:hypothetical protein BDZ94DRAFT_1268846 [Collybia nuda]